jgi:hypothetical protein
MEGDGCRCVFFFLDLPILFSPCYFSFLLATYLIMSRRRPAPDFGIRDSARLEAVGAKGTECYAGGTVKAAYC